MCGVVSLAAAMALPIDFPQRDPVLLAVFGVILATILGQGRTLGPLIGRPNIVSRDKTVSGTINDAEAQVLVNRAALQYLEKRTSGKDGEPAHPYLIATLRSRVAATRRHSEERESFGRDLIAYFDAALFALSSGRA